MKGGLVRRGRIRIALTKSVQKRMRRLVGDDVVRKAAEDEVLPAAEIAEEDGLIVLRVIGIRLQKRVRGNLELMPREAPTHTTTKGMLKSSQGPHDDGISVQSVETGIPDERVVAGIAVRNARVAVPRGCGCKKSVRGGVVVDDVNPVTPGTGRQLLGGNLDYRSYDLSLQ